VSKEPLMNRDQFQQFVKTTYIEALAIIEKKNKDYASEADAFGNILACEKQGICSAEQGVLVRSLDKISRITNLLSAEAAVEDESIDDTILDLINYFAILRALLHRTKQ
jgi:hypothetical protein